MGTDVLDYILFVRDSFIFFPIPPRVIQVRTLSLPPHPVCCAATLYALLADGNFHPTRPHHGTAALHRGQLLSRAGSPVKWALRLGVHPSVHAKPPGTTAICRSVLVAELCSQSTTKPIPSPRGEWLYSPADDRLCPCSCIQAGEKSLGIA